MFLTGRPIGLMQGIQRKNMTKRVSFLQMFSQYSPPAPLDELLAQAAIQNAELDMEERAIFLELQCAAYVPRRLLDVACRDLRALYDVRRVEMFPHFPEGTLSQVEQEELMQLFVEQDSWSRASLAGSQWSWEGDKLTVQLQANGKKALEACIPGVRRYLADRFGRSVSIEIQAHEELEGPDLFRQTEKMRWEMVEQLSKTPPPEAPRERAAAASPKGGAPAPSGGEAIFGRPFVDPVIPIRDVALDMRTVCVAGRVFAAEHKELTKNNAIVVNFDITDYTSSIRINRYFRERDLPKAQAIVEATSVGTWVKVLAKPVINRFDNEMVLDPIAILPHKAPKRLDTAADKRVELHLHTNMSNMDALTETTAAVKQAAAWGHQAIAITDHGCAQSFPEAMKAASKAKVAGTDQNIKILYGCEGYYVNDIDDRIVVHGPGDWDFAQEYVAFDLETTGLSSQHDEIIEIGAVILKEGREVDRFQSFVDPGRLLTQKIVDLTGITDEMLKGAPGIGEVLPRFLAFCGDRPLVAHNADFDVGFVSAACRRLGIAYGPTYLDTLILSQNLLPQLGKFKLDIVANALSLPEFNHHRAADDALTCGLIFHRLSRQLEEMGLHSLQAINPAMPALRAKNKIGDRHARHIILLSLIHI